MRTRHLLLLVCTLKLVLPTMAQPNTWTRIADIGYNASNGNRIARQSAVTFSIGGVGYMGTGTIADIAFADLWAYDPVSNTWSQRADLPGAVRTHAVAFSVGGKGFVGTGETLNGVLLNDLWEYDPIGNNWTQRADVPGTARRQGLAFVIGSKAYVGAGVDASLSLLSDFHEYDPTTNTWSARANLPVGSGRQGPSGFAVGSKGYSVGGYNGSTTTSTLLEYDPVADTWTTRAPLPATGRMFAVALTLGTKGHLATGMDLNSVAFNDHWEYDPVGDAWTQRTSVPGLGRRSAMAFELAGLGYICLGTGPNGTMDDMHAFNPATNAWTARASFGELARSGAASFTVNGKGYVGGGVNDNVLSDLWEYDPLSNSWAQRADLPGVQRIDHVMFAIGSKGYMGTGLGAAPLNDFWEYDPVTNAWTAKAPVPGTGVFRAASFVIGNKGYVCTGQKANSQMTNELQEYDPATNTWTGRAPVPTFGFQQAAGFAIGDRGYLVGGLDPVNGEMNTTYSYHQPSNTWGTNLPMPGVRAGHVAFAIGERGYVATGRSGISTTTRTLWEFNPMGDVWTTRASLPQFNLEEAAAFVIGERAYVGTGLYSDAKLPIIHRYEPVRDISVQVTPFNGILCPGGTKYVKYSPNVQLNAGNTFTVQLSDASGNFTSPTPTILGSANSTVGGTIAVVIPVGLPLGSGYRIRAVASDPALEGSSFGNFTMIAACTNDDPCEATVLTMNPNYTCAATSAGSMTSRTLSTNITDNCNAYLTDVWYTFTATSTTHRIQLAGNTTGLQHSLFQGDCVTLTQVPGSVCVNGATTNNPTGLVIGNTYWVRAGIRNGFGYNPNNGPFTICVSAPPVIDLDATVLATPLSTGCYSPTNTVSVTVLNNALTPIDFGVNPVTVTTNVTGTVTATLSGTLNSGTLAPGATVNVPMSTTLDMSAAGTYTFNATCNVGGDGNTSNDAMTAATRTVVASRALPITQNFTGFNGANLTTLPSPNDGWRGASGFDQPVNSTSTWSLSLAAQQTQLGSGVSVRHVFGNSSSASWLIGPKFVPVLGTQLSYRIAITDNGLATPEPAGMQPGDALIVRISTDCGVSYVPLLTHNASNTAGISNNLVTQTVDLSGFIGQQVIIAFHAVKPASSTNHPGYDLHLDDINIQNVTPCSGTPTAGTASLSAPGPFCAPASGLLLLSGQGTQGGIQVTWRSSTTAGGPYTTIPGANGTQASMASLPVGNSFVVAAVTCLASGQTSLSNEVPVGVNPVPTANASNNGPVCVGQNLQLTGATNIGTSFAWSGPGGFVSTSQNPSIPAAQVGNSGTYSYTATLAGCTSAPSTTTVVVKVSPVITSTTATPSVICSGGNAQLQVIAGGTPLTYCASTHANGCSGDNISNVTLNTLNNNTGVACGGTSFYTYFTGGGTQTTTLNPGSFTVSCTFGSDGSQFFGAWIDYNQDGTLSASEFLGASANAGANGTIGVAFTVPGTAFNGVTRLRIVGGNDVVVQATQACGASSSGFGETQDYNVTITGATDPASYTWSPTTFLSNTTVANPIASAVTTTTPYTVTVTNTAGCATTGTVTVSLSTVDTDSDGVVDCLDNCPTVAGQIGSSCNDGNAGTVNDVLVAGCVCQGTVGANVLVSARVVLDGPYDSGTGLMGDGLRALGLVPTIEPYTGLGYTLVGGGSGTTTSPVLAITGNNAVVDWVVLELRSSANPATMLASRSALVQRDGDVVDVDGTSPVAFSIANGSYHVAVLHRNHLGCMTAAAVALSGTAVVVDFTASATTVFGTNARKTSAGAIPVQMLWAGDVTFNGEIKYTGSTNDRDPILVTVGSTTPNNVVSNAYSTRDVNLNGEVKYTGTGNDRDPILVNVGSTTPNNVRAAQLP